jgi:hypothetical protein
VRCDGKGRKQRAVPHTGAVESILRAWLFQRRGLRDEPAFPTRTGRLLCGDAIQLRVCGRGRGQSRTLPTTCEPEPGSPDAALTAVGLAGGDLTSQTGDRELLLTPRLGPGPVGRLVAEVGVAAGMTTVD